MLFSGPRSCPLQPIDRKLEKTSGKRTSSTVTSLPGPNALNLEAFSLGSSEPTTTLLLSSAVPFHHPSSYRFPNFLFERPLGRESCELFTTTACDFWIHSCFSQNDLSTVRTQPIQTDMESQTTHGNATPSEATPLLPTAETRPKGTRSVTFSDNPVTKTFEPRSQQLHTRNSHHATGRPSSAGGGPAPPMLSALNNKLRRRSSQGTVPAVAHLAVGPKLGPQRSTKKTEKLKLLPNPDLDNDEQDEESGRDVYSQYTRIKDPTARRDAARLGKADRDRLPRVTAYCTANRYETDGLIRFLKGRGKTRGANPKLIDECIYTPYKYPPKGPRSRSRDPVQNYERRHSTGGDAIDAPPEMSDLIDMHSNEAEADSHHESEHGHENGSSMESAIEDDIHPLTANDPDFDIQIHTPEVYLFDYGVVVIWGMTGSEEARFLKEIAKFEVEKLAPDDVETELFNFYYTKDYQARIYNDFITLRDKTNYMTKLAISHALAQSVKVSDILYGYSRNRPC